MLHHIVFAKVGVPDYTCGGAAERFFAEGEERLALSLPRGYGYANKATDRWGLLYMLMNHKPQRLNGFIRYTVRYVTGEALTPVKPIWLDVRNCSGPDPVFDVPGGGRTFSTFTKSAGFTMPQSGRHRLWRWSSPRRRHPGRAAERDLRRQALRVTPDLGRPEAEAASARARPDEDVLVPLGHRNPGREGRPAPDQRGLRQLGAAHAGDGDHAPVPRAGSRRGLRCDAGARRRSRPAGRASAFSMPLPRAPKGKVSRATSTVVGEFQYGAERVVLKRGTTFTWRFMGSLQHDVTVVGGPVGFSAPWTQSGIFTHRFTKAGTYRLFCSLHPSKMVQQITVR